MIYSRHFSETAGERGAACPIDGGISFGSLDLLHLILLRVCKSELKK